VGREMVGSYLNCTLTKSTLSALFAVQIVS